MVRFQRLVGCRPGEVCMLRPCDLDRSDDVWRYVPESHKTEHYGKQRIILIGPRRRRYYCRTCCTTPRRIAFHQPTVSANVKRKCGRNVGRLCSRVKLIARRDIPSGNRACVTALGRMPMQFGTPVRRPNSNPGRQTGSAMRLRRNFAASTASRQVEPCSGMPRRLPR